MDRSRFSLLTPRFGTDLFTVRLALGIPHVASFFLNPILEELRMPQLVNQAKKVDRATFEGVVDVKWKRSCAATRKPMRANVVATVPLGDLA